MKVVKIEPYSGPRDENGLVDAYDITVERTHLYVLAAGIVVSNSKRISLLDVNALLSHGAVSTLHDSGAVRGQQNEDYWMQFMSGHSPGAPRVPMVYEKFINQLRAAGINVIRDGHQTHIMAMTNKDVDTLAGDREITSGDTVRFDHEMRPIRGGLFDARCFVNTTQIWTEHGMRRIGDIVNKRQQLKVWSYDFASQAFVLRRVVGWYRNRSEVGVGAARLAEPACFGYRLGKNAYCRSLIGTSTHEVLTPSGGKRELGFAKTLTVVSEKFSPAARQVLYGSLLGDLHIEANGGMSASHSPKQLDWLKYKLLALGEPVDGIYRTSGVVDGKVYKSYRFSSKRHAEYRDARRICYDKSGIKRVSKRWLNLLDARGLAVWFSDDGSLIAKSNTGRLGYKISTECFSRKEIERIRRWLRTSWAVRTTLSRDNERYGNRDMGWVLRITGHAADRLMSLISPFMHETLRYKLGSEPLPAVCKSCGRNIASMLDRCNRCTLRLDRSAGRVATIAVHRFGSTAKVRELRRTGVIPKDSEIHPRWHRLAAAWGSKSAEFAADCHRVLSLREVPAKYRHGELKWHRETRVVYDIEVEGTHNYFANGVLVSNCTGGHGGKRWSFVRLPEPLPNPVMEEPVRRILGLTQKQYENVLSGGHDVAGFGSGPGAIAKALDNIDVDREIATAKTQFHSGKASTRDDAVRKWGYLKSAKAAGLHPRDWMLAKAPVLPPAFRPVSLMGDSGIPLVSDANYLYKELLDAGKNYREMLHHVDEKDAGPERLAVYHALKAVTGLGDPVHPKLQEKGVKGILKSIFGSSPKFSTVQRKLISSTVDNVGRAVITPNPDYDMDTVGVPEEQAFKVYSKMIVRRLRRRGMPIRDALRHIEDKSDLARDALVQEMDSRPVFINRAPVLHKFGIMAFRPKLVKGSVLQVSPLIVGGFNADFDGNCADYDTEVLLRLDQNLLQCSSPELLRVWEECVMRLTGDTLVTCVRDGLPIRLKIGEFPRGSAVGRTKKGQQVYAVPAGVSVVSYDHDTGCPVLAAVTRFTTDAAHACVRVTTTRGREVIVSDNESLCVFDPKVGTIRKGRPADCAGMLMPYVKRDPLIGSGYSRELGWWYGALVADGWVRDRMVGYSKNEAAKRNEFVRIAKEQISDAFVPHEYAEDKRDGKFSDSVKVHLNGVHLAKKIFSVKHEAYRDMAYDPTGTSRSALYKRIPLQLLDGGSRECLLGLLAGLLDGDSTFGWNMVTGNPRLVAKFNTSSPFLVPGILDLLRKLGVRAGVTECPAKGRSKASYVICPSVVDLAAVLPECRLIGSAERNVAAAFIASTSTKPPKDDIDIVPISSELAAKAMSLVRDDKSLYAILFKAKKTGRLGRESARRLVSRLTAEDHRHVAGFASTVAGSDIHWEAVDTVQPVGNRDVFDLEVPDTKVYAIANGLIIWDTMQFHVPTTDNAVKEAYEKMLPSRSLLSPADFKSPVHKPGQQYLAGNHFATDPNQVSKRPPRHFRSKKDAIEAYARGEVAANDRIVIVE